MCVFSPHFFNLSVFSPRRRDHLCLYCCHFAVHDLDFCLPSVCRQVTSLCIPHTFFFLSHLYSSSLCFFTRDLSLFHAYCLSFSSSFLSLSLQCSPLLKVRRLIQKTESAWRCVVSTLLPFFLVKMHSVNSLQTLPTFHLKSELHMGKQMNNNLFSLCLSFDIPSSNQTPKKVEVHSIHTYVALYKFLPQEKNDLELQSVTFLCILYWLCKWEGRGGTVYLVIILLTFTRHLPPRQED